jgi:hypothetical protein
VALSPSGDQAILGTHLLNVGTPYSSLSTEAKFLYGGTGYGGLVNMVSNTATFPVAIVSDRDGSDAASGAQSAMAVVTNNGSNNNNQELAISAYAHATGSRNFGQLNALTANLVWDGSGTLANATSIFVATPSQGLSPGTITQGTGIWITSKSGTSVVNHRGLYIENQGTAAGNYAIQINGGNSDFGPNTQQGGTFNARTGYQVNGVNFITSSGYTVPGGTASNPGIISNGSSNTGLHFQGANIFLTSNGTDNMQIDSVNGVELLNAAGIGFSSGSAGSVDTVITRLGSDTLGIGAAYNETAGTLKLGTLVATNVGIGTANPRLQVTGPDTASTSVFAVVNSASTTELSVLDNGNATLAGNLIQNSDQRCHQRREFHLKPPV